MKKVATLCFVHDHEKILLGMKKRGFGEGRWNGFGGKVQEKETIKEAAFRELKEEVGIECNDLIAKGILNFTFRDDPIEWEVHVFTGKNFKGFPEESEEMLPKWFNHTEIPFSKMWSDDLIWLPLLLKGESIYGDFHFDSPKANNILHYNLKTKEN